MRRILLHLSIILISLISCSKQETSVNKTVKETPDKFNINDDTIKRNLNDAIKKGDTLAYIRSLKAFTVHGYEKEFLYYAIKMAEEHNYPLAYENVYTILVRISEENGYKTDSKIGDYYLLRAYELGSKSAKYDLESYYKGKKIPNSKSILDDSK
ncbi:hypothetical protein C1637_15240 [Chryseobacterium lactis]|uniref:Sel1 repeat family protein n=1 Tax=Chryseobacterium lactis TaxID=1241981 RepID=A0A3G6RLS0_CHRLC|nr:hypothetical protein [Chryseobacterium lactis]AZA83533.1 hypothetical protein EG342_17325 [Chryseobacterium lactis]AZB03917.1 hypothetical protein EG341_08200 [Chryseobacterium lactis]PNW13173.1 hypothetical protein C1637_15240 [Chryseobacterium lactis]